MNQLKKRVTIFFAISILASGCQYFNKNNTPSKEDLLKKELKKINWNTVDQYPSLPACDSITNKKLQKDCFFQELTKIIYDKIVTDSINKTLPHLDSLKLKITVFPNAKMTFETILPSSAINPEYTDSILKTKLVHFPPVQPAIKRGLKVKSQFIIPIIVKKN